MIGPSYCTSFQKASILLSWTPCSSARNRSARLPSSRDTEARLIAPFLPAKTSDQTRGPPWVIPGGLFKGRPLIEHRDECGTHQRRTGPAPATFGAQSSLHRLVGLPAHWQRDCRNAVLCYETSPSTRSW